MPESRNRRSHARSGRVLLLVALSALSIVVIAPRNSVAERYEGTPDVESTPLSQATADNVAIALLSASEPANGTFVLELRVFNQGDQSITLDESLIIFEVRSADGTTALRPITSVSPPLPCAIASGSTLTLQFAYILESGDEAVQITVGISEIDRSGAKVILPFAPGSGASAISGAGAPGASAEGNSASATPTATFSATPGASPEAGSCQT